jgi:hypothetical protein
MSRVRRARLKMTATPQRPVSASIGSALKVGCFGRFNGLLGFPKGLFDAFPSDWSLYVCDVEHRGRSATYLRSRAAEYDSHAIPSGEAGLAETYRAAEFIKRANLDLLLVVNYAFESYALIDAVDTPCIVNVCTTSDLLHHDKIAFHIYCQSEADYILQSDRLFCGTTRSIFPSCPVYYGFIPYDRRDIPNGVSRPWRERDQLLVFHGSLYKAASSQFLKELFALMQVDSALEFVMMGRENPAALSFITALATACGVGSRVHYDGGYDAGRSAEGEVDDAGWQRLLCHLARARLAPDPWPICGGSARFEAMMMGVPSVHLGIREDRDSWGRPQPAVFHLPQLHVEQGTAFTVDAYRELCRRCLYDEAFADTLVAEQRKVIAPTYEYAEYWRQLDRLYGYWLRNHAGEARRAVVSGLS